MANLYFSSLETLNFRSLPDDTKISFNKKTDIEGINGTGKTSIQMAILSCLTGLSLDGKNNIEKYKKDTNKPLRVSTQIIIEIDGKKNQKCELILEMKTATKIFFFNGKKISQKDVLKKFRITNLKKFIASMSPTFLMSLPESEILEIVSDISCKEKEKLALKVLTKTELKKVDLENIGDSLKKIKKSRIEEQKKLNEVTISIANNMGQIEALSDIDPTQTKYSKTEHNKVKKEMEIAQKIELLAQQTQNGLGSLNEVMREKFEANVQARKNKKTAIDRSTKIKNEASLLSQEIKKINQLEKPEIPIELRKKISAWEKQNQKINTIEMKLSELRDEFLELVPVTKNKVKTDKEVKVIMQEKTNSFIVIQSEKIKKLKDKIKGKEITELKDKLMRLEFSENHKKSISVSMIERKINADTTKKESITEKLNALSRLETKIKELPKNELRKRAKEVATLFPDNANIEIITEEDDKSCFKIKKDGHDYYWLSSSEKMKISTRMSRYISKRSKNPFNTIFIDNAEMLSNETSKNTAMQIITAKVSSNKKLTINGEEV